MSLSDAEIFVRAAFLTLQLHEHFHHKVECLGIRLHVATRQPLYVPYMQNVYLPARGSDDLLEEALANAQMVRRLSEDTYVKRLPKTVRAAMRSMLIEGFPNEPPGYRLAGDFLSQREFEAGENRLQAFVRETTKSPIGPEWHWNLAPRLTQGFFDLKRHQYVVVPMGASTVLPRSVFAYSCSQQQLISLAERGGYVRAKGGGKGSHTKLRKAGCPPIVVPHGKDLSDGVIGSTLLTLGAYRLSDLPGLLSSAGPLVPAGNHQVQAQSTRQPA